MEKNNFLALNPIESYQSKYQRIVKMKIRSKDSKSLVNLGSC